MDRLIDIVVASPGRLLQHKLQSNVYLSQVTHIIIDEVDTMLTQGFGSDIRAILRSVITYKNPEEKSVQLVMATATLTKAVRLLINDVQFGGFNIEYSDPDNKTPRQNKIDDPRIKINIVEVDGVHRSLPNVKHMMEDVKGIDKLIVLKDVLTRHRKSNLQTLIFCNTVTSCRAVEYAINQDNVVGGSFSGDKPGEMIHATSYHGDLNSIEREQNLANFRNGRYLLHLFILY